MDELIIADTENLWVELIAKELNENPIIKNLSLAENGPIIAPPKEKIFRAFQLTPYNSVKVVIIGQDPYPQVDENFNPFLNKKIVSYTADGLAFSAYKMTNSLRNIFNAIEHDIGVKCTNTDLTNWAKQGVLLLNSALTVEKDNPGSHIKEWRPFLMRVLDSLNNHPKRLIFLLWGAESRKLSDYINPRHVILTGPHPARNSDFKLVRHFSSTNKILELWGESPINWLT